MKNKKIENYWTKAGLRAKEENRKNKIRILSGNYYTDKDGNRHYHSFLRQRTAKDFVVNKPVVETLTKEQYRTLFNQQKSEKKVRQDSLLFSELHNKLVAGLYMKPNKLKQQAVIAKHEKDIEDIKNHLQQVKIRQKKEYDSKANNIIEIFKTDSKGCDYLFMTVCSNKKIKELQQIAQEMVNNITIETGTKTTADIYSRSTYPLMYHIVPKTDLAA